MSFLSKKSWHAKSNKNQAKVREAEQAAAEEAKRTEQRRRELQEERETDALRKLHAKAGGAAAPERLEWMYQTPLESKVDERKQDEYLLGKRMPDEKGDNVIKQVQEASGSLLVKPSAAGTSMNDLKSKLRDDPLMLIKQREAAHLRNMNATQAHMHRQREQDIESAHREGQEKDRREGKDKKDKHKRHKDKDRHHHKDKHRSSHSRDGGSVSDEEEEERRRRDKKRRRTERSSLDHQDERAEGDVQRENGSNGRHYSPSRRDDRLEDREEAKKVAKRMEGDLPSSSSLASPALSSSSTMATSSSSSTAVGPHPTSTASTSIMATSSLPTGEERSFRDDHRGHRRDERREHEDDSRRGRRDDRDGEGRGEDRHASSSSRHRDEDRRHYDGSSRDHLHRRHYDEYDGRRREREEERGAGRGRGDDREGRGDSSRYERDFRRGDGDHYRGGGYGDDRGGRRDYRDGGRDYRGGGGDSSYRPSNRRGAVPEMSDEERARRLAEMSMSAAELASSRSKLLVESRAEEESEQMEHRQRALKANQENLQVDFIAQMNHDAIRGTSVEDRVSRGRFYMEKGE